MGSIVGSLAELGLPQAVGRGWELGWSYRLPVQHRPNMVQAQVLELVGVGGRSGGACGWVSIPGLLQTLWEPRKSSKAGS